MPGKGREEDRGRAEIRVDLGLGGLLKGLGSLIELAAKLAEEQGVGQAERQGEVRGPGGARAVYGISVRLGGKPVVERFGNVRETEHGAVVEETREPYTDVFDEGEEVVVLAELPGVDAADIKVEVHGDVLSLRAESAKRKYAKELLLPAEVEQETMKMSYSNGILEIRLHKKPGGRDK